MITLDLNYVPIEESERRPIADAVKPPVDHRGPIIRGPGFSRRVYSAKYPVDSLWYIDRLAVDEHLVEHKKRNAGPVDELGEILLLLHERIVVGDEIVHQLKLTAPRNLHRSRQASG